MRSTALVLTLGLLLLGCSRWSVIEGDQPHFEMERAYLRAAERMGLTAADHRANSQYYAGGYGYGWGSHQQDSQTESLSVDLFGIHIIGIHNR